MTIHKNAAHSNCEVTLNNTAKINKTGTISKRIHCIYCEKGFNKKETFDRHIKTHHGEETENCRKFKNYQKVARNISI